MKGLIHSGIYIGMNLDLFVLVLSEYFSWELLNLALFFFCECRHCYLNPLLHILQDKKLFSAIYFCGPFSLS